MSELVQMRPPVAEGCLSALNSGWRAAVLKALGIGGDAFQMLLGTLGAAGQSAMLCRIADMAPLDAAVAMLPPAGAPTRSASYGRLLDALAPESDNGLRGALGPDYPDWVRHRSLARPGATQAALFGDWCRRLPAPQSRLALQRFLAAPDPLDRSRDAFWSLDHRQPIVLPGRGLDCVPSYGGPEAAGTSAMFALRDGTVAFDSHASHAAQPATWFRAAHAGVKRILPGLPVAAAAELEPAIAAARLTITGRIGARALVPVVPGRWYDPIAIDRALAAEDDEMVWDAWSSAGRWASFFGTSGKLARHVSHLVMVSDVSLDLVCDVRLPDLALAAVAKALPCGLWPFLGPRGQSLAALSLRPDPAGALRVHYSAPAPQCWGAIVEFAV